MSAPTGDWTLDDTQQWLRERVTQGAKCPCCTRFTKQYDRPLAANIARVLTIMSHFDPDEWVYLPHYRSKGQDEAIARHWGLIEKMPGGVKRPDGSSRVGWYRLTRHGRAFVNNQTKVPKYARIYANRFQKLCGPLVSIVDCLGEEFNYAELMAEPK